MNFIFICWIYIVIGCVIRVKIPKGKFLKVFPKISEYRIVTEQLTSDKFNGYLLVNTPIEGLNAKGYLVFEDGVPVLAYYEHKDVLNCHHALKNIAENFTNPDSILELYELTKHKIDICKMYVSCVNKPGSSITALDLYEGVEPSISSVDELSCEKANGATPKESMCNICKIQCISSIADPTHVIAKRFVKNISMLTKNRDLIDLNSVAIKISKTAESLIETPVQTENISDEIPSDNEIESFLKESMNSFKDNSDVLLESIGLAHMKR